MKTIALAVVGCIFMCLGIAAARHITLNFLHDQLWTSNLYRAPALQGNGIYILGTITAVSPSGRTMTLTVPGHYAESGPTALTITFDEKTVVYRAAATTSASDISTFIGLPARIGIADRDGPLYATGIRPIISK